MSHTTRETYMRLLECITTDVTLDNLTTAELVSLTRGPAHARLHELTERLFPADMTTHELLAVVAILEAVDQRVNARTAPVLQLLPT